MVRIDDGQIGLQDGLFVQCEPIRSNCKVRVHRVRANTQVITRIGCYDAGYSIQSQIGDVRGVRHNFAALDTRDDLGKRRICTTKKAYALTLAHDEAV